jgi:hypothetical protein
VPKDCDERVYSYWSGKSMAKRRKKRQRPSAVPDSVGLRFRVGDEAEVLQVPKQDATIRRAGCQKKFVRMKLHLGDGRRVLTQFRQQPTRTQVPNLQTEKQHNNSYSGHNPPIFVNTFH